MLSDTQQPDIQIAGFDLWIHGRQFPECDDYCDGNWLDVTARCLADSSVVTVNGPFIHLPELHQWMNECKNISASLSGEAKLSCMEPNIALKIKMICLGNCELSVFITPDNLLQEHSFRFAIDQSYLPHLIKSLEVILNAFPLKK